MQPRIVHNEERIIVGVKAEMSFENIAVPMLWKQLMPRLNEILYRINEDFISMTIYGENHFKHFNVKNIFEKWAAVQVSHFDECPLGFSMTIIPANTYAVFDYKGAANDHSIFQYIFNEYLPSSDYALLHAPHFEILGAKYSNTSHTSEEEIWIPIVNKQ